ncbi:MAG: hypothetical protein WCP28_10740 [Actinomycetes bacterium]
MSWDPKGPGNRKYYSPPLVQNVAESRQAGRRHSDEGVSRQFVALAHQWRSATCGGARAWDSYTHLTYQKIIGLGPQALPLLLRDSKENPMDWLWALVAIVGQDIAAGVETIEEAARTWRMWAVHEGIISHDDF